MPRARRDKKNDRSTSLISSGKEFQLHSIIRVAVIKLRSKPFVPAEFSSIAISINDAVSWGELYIYNGDFQIIGTREFVKDKIVHFFELEENSP